MIRARAAQDADFKRCCMLTGELDGSDRDYFFQVVASLWRRCGAVLLQCLLRSAVSR